MTDRRTKREREADDLLCAAERWQNEDCISIHEPITDVVCEFLGLVPTFGGTDDWIVWASAALSEVAWHRGHDIVNADGSPTEHVTSFAPVGGVRDEDGTERVFYGAARRMRRGR
jgi:hypothetical protein